MINVAHLPTRRCVITLFSAHTSSLLFTVYRALTFPNSQPVAGVILTAG